MWDRMDDGSSETWRVAQMIGDTESEIFDEASGSNDHGNSYPDDNAALVDDLSRTDDWDGNPVSDRRLIGEAAGNEPGSTMGDDLVADDAAALLGPYQQRIAELEARNAQLEPAPAAPPDMFVDPEGYTEWLINTRSGVPANQASRGPAAPDMFAEPERYTDHIINESARRASELSHNHHRIQASLESGLHVYGDEYAEAYDALNNMDPRSAQAQSIRQTVLSAANPAAAVMASYAALRAADDASQRYGSPGPSFAPMLPQRRQLPRGFGSSVRSRGQDPAEHRDMNNEQAVEAYLFDSAFDDE